MKRLALSLSLPVLAIAVAATTVRADDTPIKIGVLVALSGPFADYGQEMLNGMNLYLAQHGDTIAGRKLQFITKDDQSSGDVAKTSCARDDRQRQGRYPGRLHHHPRKRWRSRHSAPRPRNRW